MSIYKPGRPFKCYPRAKTFVKPPAAPGEYRIRDPKGNIVYVGETNNLSRRMNEHLRNGKLSPAHGVDGTFEYKVADGRSTSTTRRVHEQQKIVQHHPSLNKSIGGEGRPAKR